jgi:hypothetical protein
MASGEHRGHKSTRAKVFICDGPLCPLVIARKKSFGSQSEKEASTREILMTVLHRLKKRTPDAMAAFESALDKIANQHRKVFLIRGSQVRILPGVLPVLWLALSVICL